MTQSGDGAPPLRGVRIIDFGHYLAGPLAGMLLADQGAEVIKVDRPAAGAADPIAGSPFDAVLNRGKQRLQLDLKDARGRDRARQLIASADVVIENFRPGIMERLGLGAAELTAHHPRLIYLSLPGFLASDVEHASIRAFEGVVSAATGLFTDLHGRRRALAAPPNYTPLPVSSAYAAVHGALAVTLALYARAASGQGEVIEVPLSGAMMSAMGTMLLQIEAPPPGYGIRTSAELEEHRRRMQQAGAAEQRQLIDALAHLAPPMSDSYQTADGKWAFMWAGSNRRHSTQLLKALGIYDDLIAAGMTDQPLWDDLTRTDNVQFIENLTPQWRELVRAQMAAAFRGKPAPEWTAIMARFGVPFSIHRCAGDWLQAPEPEASALTVTVDDPVHGPIRQFGVQTSLGRPADSWLYPGAARPADLAALLNGHGTVSDGGNGSASGGDGDSGGATAGGGAHGHGGSAGATAGGGGHDLGGSAGSAQYAAAADAQRAATEAHHAADTAPGAAAATAAGGPQAGAADTPILDGITVLDLSTVLAGPCAARTLAEYGAEVIKIDSPDPYFSPRTTCWSPIEVSQGKRSLILDLKQAAGREIFHELVERADVIVHNFRPGVAERLGIDYPTITRRNPEIVYLSLTAFNGPLPGPWMNLAGFDPVLQAASGIMLRYGGKEQKPELHGYASCIDYLTGYSGALGVALALLQRRLRGGGDLVLTSLAQSAQLVQAPFLWATAAHAPGSEPHGTELQGEHALQRLYRAQDGWLFLAGLPSELERLRALPELSEVPLAAAAEAERISRLEAAIEQQPVAFWVDACQAAGLGCHRVDCLEDIRDRYLHAVHPDRRTGWDDDRSISIVRMQDHPAGSTADTPAPRYARFRHTTPRLCAPMPKLGTDTRAILRELGHTDSQIDDWAAAGVAGNQLHEQYLPR